MYYVGIDHHKKYSQVAVMDPEGNIRLNCKVANEMEAFKSVIDRFPGPYQAVVEATRTWGKVHDIFEDELNIETKVASPLKTRAIAEAQIKTDSIDAATLAHLLRSNLVPEIHVPPKEIREQKNLLRHRVWLVKLNTMTKNRIHNIIDRNHVQVPVERLFRKTGIEFLQQLRLSEIDENLLKDNLEILDTLKIHIKRTEDWVEEILRDDPAYNILMSLPGFGKIFSALVTLEISDINRFRTPEKFASYCCLIPSTYASGGRVSHGRLLNTGNHWLKYAFIEASWKAIRNSVYCKTYYERIRYKKNYNVAICAMARRLSEIAYRCLMEKRNYEERVCVSYSK